MKALLIACLAFFTMFLGTANAGTPFLGSYYGGTQTLGTAYAGTLMGPNDATDDWYISGNEPELNVIDPAKGNVFGSSTICVETDDMTDTWYCNQTAGCPMCAELKAAVPKSTMDEMVPQFTDQNFGWYS